jgi:hypothetical protein
VTKHSRSWPAPNNRAVAVGTGALPPPAVAVVVVRVKESILMKMMRRTICRSRLRCWSRCSQIRIFAYASEKKTDMWFNPWQVVTARDAEVKALTEKLKAFASETRRLIEQLKAETVLLQIYNCVLLCSPNNC